jgi:hydroxymethylbilane synthase
MNQMPLLRIGSRASRLAQWQAEWVERKLDCCTALVWVKSTGDQDRTTDLTQFGGTGIFTAELHKALQADRVDCAVHSLKDLPAAEEAGISLACVPRREDTRDALIARDGLTLDDLPEGARVGTGSPRRVAQLKRHRPDLVFEAIRGNVDTRIAKVHEGPLDAVVLALAGLRRLGREGDITQLLPLDVCVPAAGQGALGITIREGDARAAECLSALRDVRASACTAAERAVLQALGAGCHTPVGAHATIEDGHIRLHVRLCSLDGRECLETHADGALAEAAQIGRWAAEELRAQGADRILGETT